VRIKGLDCSLLPALGPVARLLVVGLGVVGLGPVADAVPPFFSCNSLAELGALADSAVVLVPTFELGAAAVGVGSLPSLSSPSSTSTMVCVRGALESLQSISMRMNNRWHLYSRGGTQRLELKCCWPERVRCLGCLLLFLRLAGLGNG
jgi:hypothetical protein